MRGFNSEIAVMGAEGAAEIILKKNVKMRSKKEKLPSIRIP